MRYNEEYGAHFDLKYCYLLPESIDECGLCLQLVERFPTLFKLIKYKRTGFHQYELRLQILEDKEDV